MKFLAALTNALFVALPMAAQTLTVTGSATVRQRGMYTPPTRSYGVGEAMRTALSAEATQYTVSNTATSGAGSFAQAVIDANADGGITHIVVEPSLAGSVVELADRQALPDNCALFANGLVCHYHDVNTGGNNWIQDLRVYAGTRYAGGYIRDFVDQGGGLWKSSNEQWVRLTDNQHVASVWHNGHEEGGGVEMTEAADEATLIANAGGAEDGKWFFDASDNELLVRTGGSPTVSADPRNDQISVSLNKSLNPDCLTVGGDNVVVIHCTFGMGTDIPVLVGNKANVVFAYNMIGEGVDWAHTDKGRHSKGMLVKTDNGIESGFNILVYKTLFVRCRGRTPRAGDSDMMCVNCVASDFTWTEWTDTNDPAAAAARTTKPYFECSFMGNYLHETNTASQSPRIYSDEPNLIYLDATNYWGGQVRTSPWTESASPNLMDHRDATSSSGSDVPEAGRADAPHDDLLDLVLDTASDAKDDVQANAGALPSNRDGFETEWAALLTDPMSTESNIVFDWRPDIPACEWARVESNGTDLTLQFSEAVDKGAGWAGGQLTLTFSGGAVTATYSSGDGTDTWVYTLSRTIVGQGGGNEGNGTMSIAQPGNAIEATTDGDDLIEIFERFVINDSTQT